MKITETIDIPLSVYWEIPGLWGRMLSIEVEVDGDRFPFLFDTGGGLSVISPAIAGRMGAEHAGSIAAIAKDGQRIERPVAKDIRLGLCPESEIPKTLPLQLPPDAVKSNEEKNKDAPLYIDHRRAWVHDVQESMPIPIDWPKLGGLISLDSFRGLAITIELSKNNIRIETQDSLKERIKDMTELSMKLEKGTEDIFLDAYFQVNGIDQELWMEFDTGNPGPTILSYGTPGKLGLDLSGENVRHEEGNEERAEMWIVDSMDLSLTGFEPVTAPAVVTQCIHDGVIGHMLAEQLIVTLDLNEGRAWTKRSKIKKPDEDRQ